VFSSTVESIRHPETPNPGSERSRSQSSVLDILTFRIQETSVLVFSREYSTSWHFESRKRTFSFSVESTRHPDAPDLGNECSHFLSRVVDTPILRLPRKQAFSFSVECPRLRRCYRDYRTDSATAVLVYNSDDQHVQAAAVRSAQRVPIKAHHASPRSALRRRNLSSDRFAASYVTRPVRVNRTYHPNTRTTTRAYPTRKHVTAHCHAQHTPRRQCTSFVHTHTTRSSL